MGRCGKRKETTMLTTILALAFVTVQFLSNEETSSLKCFDLDAEQRVCVEEGEETPLATAPADEFPVIQEVEKVAYYNI